jgi:hypothetical protein
MYIILNNAGYPVDEDALVDGMALATYHTHEAAQVRVDGLRGDGVELQGYSIVYARVSYDIVHTARNIRHVRKS